MCDATYDSWLKSEVTPMALLQDIEKASETVTKHRSNCDSDDPFVKVVKLMGENKKMSTLMEKFLDALAKEVKKGNQKELTKEQQKLFDQAYRDWDDTPVYADWMMIGKYCETFCNDQKKAFEALKKLK
jgi:hypothetical protein